MMRNSWCAAIAADLASSWHWAGYEATRPSHGVVMCHRQWGRQARSAAAGSLAAGARFASGARRTADTSRHRRGSVRRLG
eukprot:scaffold4883_cov62-Phaeocystis_antarctica.AAC.5